MEEKNGFLESKDEFEWEKLVEKTVVALAKYSYINSALSRGHAVGLLQFPSFTLEEDCLNGWCNFGESWDVIYDDGLVYISSNNFVKEKGSLLDELLLASKLEFMKRYSGFLLYLGCILSGTKTWSHDNREKFKASELWRESLREILIRSSGNCYGFVYVIKLGETGFFKIGRSNNPDRRIWKEISPVLPVEPEIILTIETGDMVKLEKKLHQRFADKRQNGEWFTLSDEDIKEIEEKWQTN